MDVSYSVSGGFCFWCKKSNASALKQYTQVELKTGFVNKFVDFCKKNRLRGGKRFVAKGNTVAGDGADVCSAVAGDGADVCSAVAGEIGDCSSGGIFQSGCVLKRVVMPAFFFRFWLQSWLHNLQLALNTAFESVKQVIIILSGCVGKSGEAVADAGRASRGKGAVAGAEHRKGFVGGCEAVAAGIVGGSASVVALGVLPVVLAVGVVLRVLTGYVLGFQGWHARGAGARATTPTSSHLCICYQKFFRFWAKAKTAMSERAQNVQKHAKQSLYMASVLLDCLLKNKNAPDVFAFERTKNVLKNKKSSIRICYQKFFRFWVFYISRFKQSPKVSFC